MSDNLLINGTTKIKKPQGFDSMTAPQQKAYVDDVAADLAQKTQQQQLSPQQQMAQIEAYGRYLEQQDINQAVQDQNPLTQFLASAGVQTGKVGLGIYDMLPFTDSEAAQEGARRTEMVNNALAQESPYLNMGGRMTGGVLAAAPLAYGLAQAPMLSGLGFLGRMGTSMGSGAIEGAVEIPFSDETRTSNAMMGAVAGAAAEPVSIVLKETLKRIPFGALNPRAGDQVESEIRAALEQAGYDFDNLKPDTQQILKSISNAEDVDAAIQEAMETEFGFKLSKGQYTGDFEQIAAEEAAARQSKEAGDRMRDFKNEQNTDINNAALAMADEAGGTRVADLEQIGTVLKEAFEGFKATDKANYKALYDEAKQFAVNNNIDIPLSAEAISDVFYQMARDHMNTNGALLKDIGTKLARSGVLDPEDFKTDMPFNIPDMDTQRLGVSNSEDFIKYLNSLWQQGDDRANYILSQLKSAIEDNADAQLAEAMKAGGGGKAADQFLKQARAARQANRAYRDLWSAKDVLQEITGVKPNTKTPLKNPSEIMAVIMRSPENAERVIKQLSERGDEAAIADIRTFTLKDIFDKAVNPNQQSKDGLGLFSGAKLTTAIKKNDAALKKILSAEQYQKLKAFEVAVGKATKKPEGSVNYSGSAYTWIDTLFRMLKVTPVLSPLSGVEAYAAEKTMKEALKSGRTPVDYIMKFDDSHIKLNAVMRQVIDQSVFEDNSQLAE